VPEAGKDSLHPVIGADVGAVGVTLFVGVGVVLSVVGNPGDNRPLHGHRARAEIRMRETALAYVRHRGNAVAMAAELGAHPQIARYRIARLRELLGADLEDPDARLELELALRSA
jgi:hypothetical protein